MRIYLDICCLKRPFDDQGQPRIHMESEAVLSLLSAPPEKVEFVRGPALDLENEQNPVLPRAAKVRHWLQQLPVFALPDSAIQVRIDQLTAIGFKGFDAFHLACAELGEADFFSTCDEQLLATAKAHEAFLKVRVLNPVNLVEEVFL